MSKLPLLNESTQRRILLLAGMSHFADEVIAEAKKDGLPPAPDYAGGIKKAKGSKKEGSEEDDDKKKLLEELPQDDLESAPSAPAPAPAPAPVPEEVPAAPALDTGDLKLKKFAQEFAKFLSAQGHQIVMTVDGEDMAAPEGDLSGGEEAAFGDIDPEGESEPAAPPTEESPLDSPPEEEKKPQFESKEKTVAKLVYEEVLKTLTANAGINLDQARKNGSVKLKLKDSKK